MITVRNLCKSYGYIHAVSDVSFEVQRGEVVGFLGPNGAGKTTTMKILTGFMNPTSGSATIAGFDVVDQSMEARTRIGYLPENTPLYTDLTPREYLRFAADARRLPASQRGAAIDDAADKCGIRGVMRQPIGTLSKGFRQRVGLAQALLHRPDILILDEPTTGLDPTQIIEIRDLLKEVGRERTILLSSHILPEVSVTCSRILIINKGSLVLDDSLPAVERRLRSLVKATLVRVRSDAADPAGAFRDIPGVDSVTPIAADEEQHAGWKTLRLGTPQGLDIGEAVFERAAARRLAIAELRPEATTLEDLFIDLTRNPRPAARA
jgi:ABC-2 type transport system ATP-binding protein